MVINIRGVYRSAAAATGVTPRVPVEQRIGWARGQDGTIAIAVVDQNGAPVNLTGASLSLGVRTNAADASPVFVRAASITDAAGGLASFALVALDTSALAPGLRCRYDVWLVIAGARYQIVLASNFVILEAETLPSETAGAATGLPPSGSVDTVATLATVEASNLGPGFFIWVDAERSYFHIEIGNGYATDNPSRAINALNLPGGQWVRGLGA